MQVTYLDMDTYKRKSHFAYFTSLAYPYVGTTVNVDITELLEKRKTYQLPFFFTVCYCIAKAANSVPEFKQRIVDGGIVQFDNCRTSHTVAMEDGTYCYCTLDSNLPFPAYIAYAVQEQERAKQQKTIQETKADTLDLLFISTLPWVSYTALVQPVPIPADSNPRITWGKYFAQGDRVLLPVSVLCHHALVDGMHIAAFYQSLDEQICRLSEYSAEEAGCLQ